MGVIGKIDHIDSHQHIHMIPQIFKVRIDTPETGQEDAIYRYSILTPTTITAAYQPLIISAALHSIERREKYWGLSIQYLHFIL